jgi:hypothetical protein
MCTLAPACARSRTKWDIDVSCNISLNLIKRPDENVQQRVCRALTTRWVNTDAEEAFDSTQISQKLKRKVVGRPGRKARS